MLEALDRWHFRLPPHASQIDRQVLPFRVPVCAGKRVALVVGNNDYRNVPKLLKAVNDAHLMAETLKQLGFTVMFADSLSRQKFVEILLSFDNALESGDTAFFFYSGRGFEITGQNYLLPVDVPAATAGQEELVRDSAVPADRIIEPLGKRVVRSAILVFDACRENPFQRSGGRGLPGGAGLAPMTQLPQGVFSLFSAGPRQSALDRLSDDDGNANSVFTRIFAKEVAKPGVSLVDVAQTTRRSVAALTDTAGHRQMPVSFDQMVDDVFLSSKAAETGGMGPQQEAFESKTLGSAGAVEGAKVESQKIAAVPPIPVRPLDSANAPIARFIRSNEAWLVSFSFAEPVLAISWRMGDSGEFRETPGGQF